MYNISFIHRRQGFRRFYPRIRSKSATFINDFMVWINHAIIRISILLFRLYKMHILHLLFHCGLFCCTLCLAFLFRTAFYLGITRRKTTFILDSITQDAFIESSFTKRVTMHTRNTHSFLFTTKHFFNCISRNYFFFFMVTDLHAFINDFFALRRNPRLNSVYGFVP